MPATLEVISVDSIAHGPFFEQRKLCYDPEIVALRRNDITTANGLDQQYAIRVRPIDIERFEVIDGNLRLMLLKELNIQSIPCYIESLSADESIIAFVSSNQFNGISKLMIGMCALQWNVARGGRGNRSQRGDFCRKLKLDKSNFSRYCQSAIVFKFIVNDLTDEEKIKLNGKGNELYKIKKLPQQDWLQAAKLMAVDARYESIDRTLNLKTYFNSVENGELIRSIISVDMAMHCALRNESGMIAMEVAVNEINKAIASCRADNRHYKIDELKNYVRENAFRQEGSRNFFNFRGIVNYARGVANTGIDDDINRIMNCDARNFINGLDDASVQFALIDASWGVNKSSISRDFQTVDNDNPRYASALYNDIAPSLYVKMNDTSYVVLFHPSNFILETITPFLNAGFRCISQCVWIKSSHTIGDLTGAPLVESENFVILKKTTDAVWLKPISNIFIYPSVSRKNRKHPCQKSDLLLTDLVESCSSPGDLIIEPFMGSGETLRIGRRLKRKVGGSDTSKVHFPAAWNNIFGDEHEQAV